MACDPALDRILESPTMRSVALFAVLVVARLLSLSGTPVPFSFWTPIAYLWQDAAVALVFAVLDYLVGRDWFGWGLYGLAVLYIALNVAIVRVLFSPLTLPMIRAAGGPLADSIKYYVTVKNVAAIALTILASVLLAIIARRLKLRAVPLLIVASAFIATGPFAISKVDTAGRYRNAFGALLPMSITSRADNLERRDWRATPFPDDTRRITDLSRYRNSAAGRNVVMILLESTAARYWPASAEALDPMPNLTAFAAQGISFRHAYAVYPESIKGLLSVLCSKYPSFNVPPEVYSGVVCPALPQQLADAGYRTALFHSGRFMYLGMPSVIEKRGYEVLEDAGAIGGNVHSSFGVDDSSTVKRALSWIDSLKAGERFFITYLPVAGHHPYVIPTRGPVVPAGGNEDETRYLNALHYGDEALGELLKGLEARNLDRKTLFVIFGDHGEAFGQHDGNFGHTLFIYDENIRVPYVIVAPGLMQEPIQSESAVSLIDTAPTILDLLGLPIPRELQGTSMLDPHARMSLFFADYSLRWLGLYDQCRKYFFEMESGHSRFFDVCKDPNETIDLSDRETTRAAAYQGRLKEWIGAQSVDRR